MRRIILSVAALVAVTGIVLIGYVAISKDTRPWTAEKRQEARSACTEAHGQSGQEAALAECLRRIPDDGDWLVPPTAESDSPKRR